MPSNPMQRKVRNSFILGVSVMLGITILIGVIAFFLVIKPKMDAAQKEAEQPTIHVYRLKAGQNVTSGEEITASMVESVEIPVPSATVETDFIVAKTKDSKGALRDVSFSSDSGYKSKIDLKGGTILTQNMLYGDDSEILASLRYVEYNMITMPTTIEIGNYIDIRFRLPNGQDLIVVPKKEVISLYGQTVGFNLTEDEILLLNSAIVESYFIMPASELYVATYVEPGIQETAKHTYTPTAEVINLISSDENIVVAAKNNLISKYNSSATRGTLENAKSQYSGDAQSNIETGMQQQIEAARKAREDYLSELEEN